MDPNQALVNARRAVDAVREAEGIAEDPLNEAARDLADAFEALDQWISGGGFLPGVWGGAR